MKKGRQEKFKFLFVCTGNRDRSRTAQELFKDIVGCEARSAGTSETAPVQLSKNLIDWADKIFVMEQRHQEAVLNLAPKARRKIERLDIPDEFCFNQPELRTLLSKKLLPHLKALKCRKNSLF